MTSFLINGVQWMCRGTHTAPSTLDRSISRKKLAGAADLRTLLRLWREVDTAHAAELHEFHSRQDSKAPPLVGFRHFPVADFTAYQRPNAAIFLKTISTRTLFTESINHENQLGPRYLNCGDLDIHRPPALRPNSKGRHRHRPLARDCDHSCPACRRQPRSD